MGLLVVHSALTQDTLVEAQNGAANRRHEVHSRAVAGLRRGDYGYM